VQSAFTSFENMRPCGFSVIGRTILVEVEWPQRTTFSRLNQSSPGAMLSRPVCKGRMASAHTAKACRSAGDLCQSPAIQTGQRIHPDRHIRVAGIETGTRPDPVGRRWHEAASDVPAARRTPAGTATVIGSSASGQEFWKRETFSLQLHYCHVRPDSYRWIRIRQGTGF